MRILLGGTETEEVGDISALGQEKVIPESIPVLPLRSRINITDNKQTNKQMHFASTNSATSTTQKCDGAVRLWPSS